MTNVPLSHMYNLARLGQAGDQVSLDAGNNERAALANVAGILAVPKFAAKIVLRKLSPTHFALDCELTAEIVQACVVTLEPLTAGIARNFTRELHYRPNLRREAAEKGSEKEIVITPGDEELPEDIESLHYDLAGPMVEEFLLAIDPYPRAPGVEFAPPGEGADQLESPFAVLKGLKSGR